CVMFADHEGSTKSLRYIRDHRDPLHEIDFIPEFEQIEADYDEGEEIRVPMHDGGIVTLHKMKDHDPGNRMEAMNLLNQAIQDHKFLTGLIYVDESQPDLAELENLIETPLSGLTEKELRPSQAALDDINAALRR
ncbi:MAG: 2-oxoacid:ferredoxin oxidoreductase subunit beta, partial [SAR324 cluster bacterium]|nr:2-oxoacid:ferredoxin oxidoreductase subunit beta [SAR324 cluster bacterium]